MFNRNEHSPAEATRMNLSLEKKQRDSWQQESIFTVNEVFNNQESPKVFPDFQFYNTVTREPRDAKEYVRSISRTLQDSYTHMHAERVSGYAMLLAEYLPMLEQEKQNLELATLLHDVGKIGVEQSLIEKKGHLSSQERARIQDHSMIGASLVESLGFSADVGYIVLHHHECYDGSGYPGRLAGDEIPLEARIMSIADAFDAITTDRPYRKGRSWEVAEEELLSNANTQFDPELVSIYLKILHYSLSSTKDFIFVPSV